MRYGLIVAALLTCGPATARDPDCGVFVGQMCPRPPLTTGNGSVTLGTTAGRAITSGKDGGDLAPPPDCGIDPNNVYGVGCMNPVLKQPPVYFQPIPNQRKLAIFRGHPNPTFIGIGAGAIQSHVWGDNVIAVGRCAGASLVKGSDVILLGDYTATPGPETSNFINWRNKTCLQDGVVVQCPPPEPECIK